MGENGLSGHLVCLVVWSFGLSGLGGIVYLVIWSVWSVWSIWSIKTGNGLGHRRKAIGYR